MELLSYDGNNTYNKKYPLSREYFEGKIKLLNSKNVTIQNENIVNGDIIGNANNINDTEKLKQVLYPQLRIILNRQQYLNSLNLKIENEENDMGSSEYDFYENGNENKNEYRRQTFEKQNLKSKHFEVAQKCSIMFKDVGGYEKKLFYRK